MNRPAHQLSWYHKAKKHYGWDKEKAKQEWDVALRDPSVLQTKNKFGMIELGIMARVSSKGTKEIRSDKNISEIAREMEFEPDDTDAMREVASSLNP